MVCKGGRCFMKRKLLTVIAVATSGFILILLSMKVSIAPLGQWKLSKAMANPWRKNSIMYKDSCISDSQNVSINPNPCDLPVVIIALNTTTISKIIEMFHKEVQTKHVTFLVMEIPVQHKVTTGSRNPWPEIQKFRSKNFQMLQSKTPQKLTFLLSVEMQNYLLSGLGIDTSRVHGVRFHRGIGFLVALALGACRIWSHEEQAMPIDYKFFSFEQLKEAGELSPFTIYSHNSLATNPLLLFGVRLTENPQHPGLPLHPSGLPKEDIHRSEIPTLHGTNLLQNASSIQSKFKVGIIKTLFNLDANVYSRGKLAKVAYVSVIDNINVHPSQFTPFSSESALYLYDAFWASYQLITVPYHLGDVWQNCIVQALMRCAGMLVNFHRPVVLMQPKSHNASQENKDPSHRVADLLQKLSKFQCSSSLLSYCIQELYIILNIEGFIGKADVDGIKSWIKMLNVFHYKFPSMSVDLCRPFKDRMFTVEPPTHPREAVKNLQSINHSLSVVHINFCHKEVIPIWLSLYQYIYPKPIFYTPGCGPCSSIFTKDLHCISNGKNGYYSYESVIHAMENNPDYDVYIASHDDSIYSPRMIEQAFTRKETYVAAAGHRRYMIVNGTVTKNLTGTIPYLGWDPLVISSLGRLAKSTDFDIVKRKLQKYCPGNVQTFATSGLYDTYAINKKHKDNLLVVLKIFLKHELFLETSIPTALFCVAGAAKNKMSTLAFSGVRYNYGTGINAVRQRAKTSPYCQSFHNANASLLQIAHPVKLSNMNYILTALTFRDCALTSMTRTS